MGLQFHVNFLTIPSSGKVAVDFMSPLWERNGTQLNILAAKMAFALMAMVQIEGSVTVSRKNSQDFFSNK